MIPRPRNRADRPATTDATDDESSTDPFTRDPGDVDGEVGVFLANGPVVVYDPADGDPDPTPAADATRATTADCCRR